MGLLSILTVASSVNARMLGTAKSGSKDDMGLISHPRVLIFRRMMSGDVGEHWYSSFCEWKNDADALGGCWSKENLRSGQAFPPATSKWYNAKFGGVSEAMFDPYSFTHVIHGYLLYFVTFGFLGHIFPKFSLVFGIISFVLSFLVEVAWELIENTRTTIAHYREVSGTSEGYSGDSVLNSTGDVLSMMWGWIVADTFMKQGRGWLIVVVTLMSELFTIIYMRDSLITTFSSLVLSSSAPDFFRKLGEWQAHGIPAVV